MSKGILQVHPPICDCPGCRISSPVNRGRLAEKRTIPLPPTRTPKKEAPSIFSHSEDSEESDKVSGHHSDVKQEEDLHISIMKRRIHAHWDLNISFHETSCSRDNELTSFISNLHQSRQLVMPETQSRCEFKRSSLDIGLGAAGKHPLFLVFAILCNLHLWVQSWVLTAAWLFGTITQMTPEEHYRRMMSALNEHSTFEEQQQQQQRLYQLANSMAVPSHSGDKVFPATYTTSLVSSADLLRARQEVAAAARNPGTMEPHLPSAANSSSQRRKQGLPQHRDSHFTEREMSHPPPLLSPQNAPHIALGPHLRPPFLGVPSALCQTPGYGFLQPAQAEMFARQQEMLRKQNLASPALEDVSKWTVEDVCSFVGGLSGCAEYTQVFREQAIDGETLPLLTEEHLLNNMGLKLGPALKIRSQVAKRVGRVLYMASFPMAFPLQPPGLRPTDRDLPPAELRPSSTGSVASSPYHSTLLPTSRISPKQENGNLLLVGLGDAAKPPS
uniref:Sterile alpha motif domain containing 11 n=1 Tax=Anolis carolinensis TaxID=28377 RepID=A0A803SY28_ANOCA